MTKPSTTAPEPSNIGPVQHSCPNCGYCPHCGRSNVQPWPMTPWPSYPSYPWWYPPYTVTWQSNSATSPSIGQTYTDTTGGNYSI